MSNTTKTNITVFLDYLGRNIVAELVESTDSVLKVKNPVILHVPPSPDNSGRMSVQLFPLFFREFLADKTEDIVFSFRKDKIVETSIDTIDFRLQSQYSQMFNKNNEFVSGSTPQQQDQNQSNDVIKLFDE
jgi:hypothetical protein